MTRSSLHRLFTAAALAVLTGCAPAGPARSPLVGAWRSHVQFADGAFAPLHDLEFLYVFNAGGTLTESSNYDAAPPVPPAYGQWRATGPGRYQARYTFFTTSPPPRPDSLAVGAGWMPAGSGVLDERIALSADGRTYESTLTLALFDPAGKPVPGGGRATAHGVRAGF